MKRSLSVLVVALLVCSALSAQGLVDKFAQPDQTVEYHFMIQVSGLSEKTLAQDYQNKIAVPLAEIATVGSLGKPKAGIYIDSRDYGLEKQNLIVRVRAGQITIKARASDPSLLLDLEKGTSKKYEIDYFGTPDYSISSDIKFKTEEFDINPSAWTPETLWKFIDKKFPALMQQILPVVVAVKGIEIPGVATMYSADVEILHPLAEQLKKDDAMVESGLAVWFFPPTDTSLVELAYTAKEKDKAIADELFGELKNKLSQAGLLASNQTSKTQQYFAAYFGPRQ